MRATVRDVQMQRALAHVAERRRQQEREDQLAREGRSVWHRSMQCVCRAVKQRVAVLSAALEVALDDSQSGGVGIKTFKMIINLI